MRISGIPTRWENFNRNTRYRTDWWPSLALRSLLQLMNSSTRLVVHAQTEQLESPSNANCSGYHALHQMMFEMPFESPLVSAPWTSNTSCLSSAAARHRSRFFQRHCSTNRQSTKLLPCQLHHLHHHSRRRITERVLLPWSMMEA